MKKNIYYKSLIQRKGPISKTIASYTMMLCSTPRMLLEVFIRRNFGERYFSLPIAILVTVILGIVPVGKSLGIHFLTRYGIGQDFDLFEFLKHDLTWYFFLAGFVAMCIDREIEIQRMPNVFEFGRFSLSSGAIHPGFLKIAPFGKPISVRTIEIYLEPGYFLIIGLILWLLQQHVGILLVVCSVCYSVSYIIAYHQGDHFIMDQIDEMIFNQEMNNAFIDGMTPDQTRGVNVRARKPVDPQQRRQLAENLVQDSDVAMAL